MRFQTSIFNKPDHKLTKKSDGSTIVGSIPIGRIHDTSLLGVPLDIFVPMAIGMHTVELHFHKTALTIDIASPSQNFVLKKKKKLQIQGKCAWGHLNHSALSGILSETVKGVCYMSFPLFSGSPPLNDLVCDRPVVNDPVFNNPVFCVCVCLFF